MAGNSPWSVKGIDPKARAAAKEAAQQRGMTLGEWLSHKMLEPDNGSDKRNDPGRADTHLRPQSEFLAFSGNSLREAPRVDHRPAGADHLYTEIENLARRLEATEHRATLAITGIDQTVLGLLARLEGVEGSQDDVTEQLKNSLQTLDVRLAQSDQDAEEFAVKFSRELKDTARRIDTVGEKNETNNSSVRHEVGKDVELINTRSDEISQRLATAEKQTDAALRTLEASFVSIDQRLKQTETSISQNSDSGLAQKFDDQFSVISNELIKVVAQTRGQLAAQIEAQAANPKLDQLDQALNRMQQKFANTESRHANTLEKIANAVAKMGDAVEGRLQKTEDKTETRFVHMQQAQAEALDTVGRSMTEVVERLESRFDKLDKAEKDKAAEDELAARLQESEVRTGQLVEEALQRVHQRLDETLEKEVEDVSPVQRALRNLTDRLNAIEDRSIPPFSDGSDEQKLAEPDENNQQALDHSWEQDEKLYGGSAELVSPAAVFPDPTENASVFDQPALPPLGPEPEYGSPADFGYVEPASAMTDASQTIGATANHDFMAAARRSMLRSSEPEQQTSYQTGPSAPGASASSKSGGDSRKLLVAASIFAIVAIGGAASIALLDFGGGTNTGVRMAQQQVSSPALDGLDSTKNPIQMAQADLVNPEEVIDADRQQAATTEQQPEQMAVVQDNPSILPVTLASKPRVTERTQPEPPIIKPAAPPARQADRQMASITPAVITDANVPFSLASNQTTDLQRPSMQQAANSGDPIAQYQLAGSLVDAGQVEQAAKTMRQAAERGLPAAQYQLAKYYENGTGVAVDEREARRWTERSANGGNRRAMHNLAMFHAEGRAVPQSYENAAKWFEEAALLGLANSQFNLALLYQQGLGVAKSLPDAFAWYAIAAKAGDRGAAAKMDELKQSLPAEAILEAHTITERFRPRPLDLAANGVFRNVNWTRPQISDPSSISRAQVLLARMGYSPGPADGNIGENTRLAVISYERDNGLAQTGKIDAVLLGKLERGAVN